MNSSLTRNFNFQLIYFEEWNYIKDVNKEICKSKKDGNKRSRKKRENFLFLDWNFWIFSQEPNIEKPVPMLKLKIFKSFRFKIFGYGHNSQEREFMQCRRIEKLREASYGRREGINTLRPSPRFITTVKMVAGILIIWICDGPARF